MIAKRATCVVLFCLLVSCTAEDGSRNEGVGSVQLAIEQVPMGVRCIRVKAQRGSETVATNFDVRTGDRSVFRGWDNIPVGLVAFSGDALEVQCNRATASSTPRYIAAVVRVNVAPGRNAQVPLAMRPRGRVDVHVDFGGGAECSSVIANPTNASRGPWSRRTGVGEPTPACAVGGRLGSWLNRPRRSEDQFVDNVYPLFEGPVYAKKGEAPRGEDTFPGDNNLYSGVWRQGSDAAASWYTTSWNEFTEVWDDFNDAGLRMDDFETYEVASYRVYAGLFRAGTDGSAAWFTADWDEFTGLWDDWQNVGLRMHDFESFVSGGQRIFGGVFRAGTDSANAIVTADWNEFTSFWDTNNRRDLRMHDFEVYLDGMTPVYAGVFRQGRDRNTALFTADWSDFLEQWEDANDAGLRMHDFETYVAGNQRIWAGEWREGTGGHYAWMNVDWESLISKSDELSPFPLRLEDLEAYPSSCPAECLNQVVMPPAEGVGFDEEIYNYGITATATHCDGLPGTCDQTPAPGDVVWYRQPVNADAEGRFVRFSAITFPEQIFTLPFKNDNIGHNGWQYSPGSWHHALDYWVAGDTSFDIVAAAPGRVIHVGWDAWSGGTIIVSHDAGGVTDAYRTIYMHMRNGADNDCARAWDQTIASNPNAPWAAHYRDYLNDSGCPGNPFDRDPAEAQWGTNDEAISPTLLGSTVQRGDFLGRAGSTGPGGCGCIPADQTDDVGTGGDGPNTHLHIFFVRRDPTDNRWYMFDPYGLYGPSSCYPSGLEDAPNGACARYSIAWRNGAPALP